MPRKTPRDIKQFRDWIRTVAYELRSQVFCGEYRLHFNFDEEWDKMNGSNSVNAEIMIDCVYLQMTLSCYKHIYEKWRTNKLQDAFEVLVHEFCHLLTEPLFREMQKAVPDKDLGFITDIRERQTQRITTVLLNYTEKEIPWKKKVVNGRHKKN